MSASHSLSVRGDESDREYEYPSALHSARV